MARNVVACRQCSSRVPLRHPAMAGEHDELLIAAKTLGVGSFAAAASTSAANTITIKQRPSEEYERQISHSRGPSCFKVTTRATVTINLLIGNHRHTRL